MTAARRAVVLASLVGLLVCLSLPAAPGSAQEASIPADQRPRLAVLDFRVTGNAITGEEADYLSNVMRGLARQALPADRYVVYTKDNLEKLLSAEQKDQMHRCGDTVCEVAFAWNIGAAYAVVGEVLHFNGKLKVVLSFYETKTSNLLEMKDLTAANLGDLETEIKRGGAAILASLIGTTLGAPEGQSGTAKDKIGIEMVLIRAGTFWMGCEPGNSECSRRESPRHQVTLTRAYYMGKTEVTQGLWKKVMGNNPSRFSSCGDECPVERVSWADAIDFCNRLSDQEGLTRCYSATGPAITWDSNCTGYRLPTEAEWEYAARGGGDVEARPAPVDAMAWYNRNSGHKTHPAGQKAANGYGLSDMLGNVWEWTWDWYGGYSTESVRDPRGPAGGSDRVVRGGSWLFVARYCRSAARYRREPDCRRDFLGLRLARSVQ